MSIIKVDQSKIWSDFFEEGDKINIVQLEDSSIWFQFSHLCKILGYKNPTVALQTHCEEYEYQKLDIGLHEDVNFVSESGFYSLVLGSKKPQAKKFKKRVCTEILPGLRASGGYIMPTATSEQLEALQGQISELLSEKTRLTKLNHEVSQIDAKLIFIIKMICEKLIEQAVPLGSTVMSAKKEAHYYEYWKVLYALHEMMPKIFPNAHMHTKQMLDNSLTDEKVTELFNIVALKGMDSSWEEQYRNFHNFNLSEN